MRIGVPNVLVETKKQRAETSLVRHLENRRVTTLQHLTWSLCVADQNQEDSWANHLCERRAEFKGGVNLHAAVI